MKYTAEIEINLPVNKVVELFNSTENLFKWMEGLKSFETISGEPGQPGTKSKLVYQMGKREIEMVETIQVYNLPEEFTGTYEAKGVYNVVKNHFIPVSDSKTRYVTEQEFQFSGFMKLMGLLMPGAFKKQSMKYLQAFKNFAENEA